jgi:hypothetical protein
MRGQGRPGGAQSSGPASPGPTNGCLAVQALKWEACAGQAAMHGARASPADPIAARHRERLDKARCG